MLAEPEPHRVLLTARKPEQRSTRLDQGPPSHITHHPEISVLTGKKQARRPDHLGRGLLVLGHLSE